MEEKELFEDYELKHWEWTPRFYKIIGAAIVIPVCLFFIIGQFNLLDTHACDNLLTGKVCEVLDAVYISSTFIGDKEWSDKEYVADKFKEAEINYVDMTSAEPPFTYPEGYFALVNPENLTTEQIPNLDTMGGFTTNSTDPSGLSPSITDLINTKPKLPKQNPNPVKGDISDSPYSIEGDNKTAKLPSVKFPKPNVKTPPKNDPPKKLPNLDENKDKTAKDTNTNTDVKKDDKKSESTKTNDELATFTPNKKPLEDLRDVVKEKLVKKEIDLKAPFSITIDGVLTKEGKLDTDPKKTHYTSLEGDPKMIDLAKSAVEAVNASGLFTYLNKLGGKRILVTLQQDKDNITAVIKSQIDNEANAKSIASGFNTLISIGKMTRKGKDEEVLLNAAKVTSEGKTFIMNFALPQQIAQDLIQKQLKDAEEEKKTQPNSVATSKDAAATGK